MVSKRNGEIDILRFVFSVIIVIHHFCSTFNYSFFESGYIGVEFFFLVSGYLMARTTNNISSQKDSLSFSQIADSSWSFIVKKIKSFYSYYICAIVIQILIRNIIVNHEGPISLIGHFLKSIPTFTLTFMGLNNNSEIGFHLGGSWYLSAMIIAMLILFPLLLKNFNFSTKLVFPLLSIFILGYLYTTDYSIANWQGWSGICFNGVLRALGELALGASIFVLSNLMKNKYHNIFNEHKTIKLGLTIVKYMCFIVVISFAFGILSNFTSDLHALLFCAIGIFLSFSGITYTIPESKLSNYLGKLSLPIYIFHGFMRHTAGDMMTPEAVTPLRLVLMIVFSIILCVVLMYITDAVKKLLNILKARILS